MEFSIILLIYLMFLGAKAPLRLGQLIHIVTEKFQNSYKLVQITCY